MENPDAKSYYSRGRNMKAPLPNVDAIIKQVKNNPKFEQYLKKNASQSKPHIKHTNSSFSNRSGSRDSISDSERFYSNENSFGDVLPTNDTSKDSPKDTLHRNKPGSKNGKLAPINKPGTKSQPSVDPDDSYILKEITSFERFVIEQTIPTPLISAKSWVIMDLKTGEVLYAKRDNKRREIASLTKMMTMLVVCKLCKKYNIDPRDMYIQVSKLASTMIGTSAKLKYGDILSIWDLLHGLMLPSGNDAAYTLAESFGTYIYLQSDEYKLKVKENPEYATHKVKNPVKFFLDLMNKTAEELELSHTFYANPHGLINQHSHSTAVDQAKLAYVCWKLELFRDICAKKTYTCEIEQIDTTTRIANWETTNKLLGKEGWTGLKTGITSAAGPCFVGTYEKGEDNYLIVLLCSASMDVRWTEAPRLVNWIVDTRKKFKLFQ